VAVIGFKDDQAGVEQRSLRYDDHVETGRDLVSTENLSNQSFSSIPLDGASKLPGGGNAKPSHREVVRGHEQHAVAAVDADSVFVYVLKFDAPADPFVATKSHRLQLEAC
jgi:hypothetical protein